MPVSTFSSDSSALRRDGGQSATIARWNSTRDRISEDERRVSESEVTEMDGTGLHQRENWPLAETKERSVSPETVISVGSEDGSSLPTVRSSKTTSKTVEVGSDTSEDAVMRKAGDITQQPAYTEQDVSDVEETAEEDQEESGGSEEDLNDAHDSGRQSSPVLPTTADSRPSRTERDRNAAEVSPVRPTRQTSLGAPEEEQPEVSPVREQHAAAEDDDELYEDDDSVPYINGEDRDVTTPIPYGLNGTHDYTPLPSGTSPRINGGMSPTAADHSRRSSAVRNTPPPSSRRSASISKAPTPHNRGNIRYSWQSIQDQEPNRPRIHIIKLVSNTATASAGFPQGEALSFSISPCGRRIAAYNSARLYVLQAPALPVGISQDYALKRRPLAVEVTGDGNTLAILADEHTMNVYDLGHQQVRRIKIVKTDFPANCIALSSTGGLLAAGYEGGVEIFSLDPSALPTDRRAVRCQRMDRLAFSEDGSTLLGTTTRINTSYTVVISVPVFPAAPNGVPTHEELREAWTAELLHPENIRNSSHATFMREGRENCNDRVFAWNGVVDTFGVLNVADMEYGTVDFPVLISPPLSTCGGLGAAIHSCPAIDELGDTVAMVVNDRTIRLYIVPPKSEDDGQSVEAHSIDHELDEGYGCPFTEVRWVYSSASLPAPVNNQMQVQGRLIVASPGGVPEPSMNEEMIDDIEGGRIILFDFDPQFAGQPGQTFSLTLGKTKPQLLEEPALELAEQVAIVRRRTVNQNKSGTLSQRPVTLGRAATTFGAGRGDRSLRGPSPAFNSNPRTQRASVISIHSMQSEATRSLPDLMETNETADTFEEPYAQNAPRSHASLQRAASNAQRHRFQTLEERTQERVSAESSGNFLALPEYTEEPNAPLPSRFRQMAGLDVPSAGPGTKASIVTNANGDHTSPTASTPTSAVTAIEEEERATGSASQSRTSRRPNNNAQSATSPFGQVSRANTFDSADSEFQVQRSNTFDSLGPMPRSLQRAYRNAPPQNLVAIPDGESISPISGGDRRFPPRASSVTRNANSPPTRIQGPGTVPEEEPWDAISPVPQTAYSPFARQSHSLSGNQYRYSTSLLNPPGHTSPDRATSSASSYGMSSASPPSTASSRTRRLPPHIQAFRQAANQSAAASLFPPTQSPDHVPLRNPPINVAAGSVPHPVTAWHPPAPSSVSSGGQRGHHTRVSSTSNKSAFASTERARKLGFFRSKSQSKRKKKKDFLYGHEFANPQASRGGAESTMDAKSIFTTFTNREVKCVIM